MERRSFLSRAGAGVGIGAALVAAPAITKAALPAVRWRCQSGFPRALDILFDTSLDIARRVSEGTGGRFDITIAPAGEIVPVMQSAEAVMAGTIESANIGAFWFIGKSPIWAFGGGTIPFGMNGRQFSAWWKDGDGERMFNDWMRQRGALFIVAGHTGTQIDGRLVPAGDPLGC